jgi:hypothetical protein
MFDPATMLLEFRKTFGKFGTELTAEEAANHFADTLHAHATDDFVCVMNGGALTTTYEGIEGLRSGWRDFLAAFDSIEIVPGEFWITDEGNVVEFVKLRGKPKGVAAEIDQDAAAVWRARGTKLASVGFYIDRREALTAGGLDPDDPGQSTPSA